MSAQPQSVIGPYRLLRLVNAGGEGSVFEAEDTRLERRVAIKLLPLAEDPAARSAQLGEARALAALSHSFILKIHDVLELPDALALVLELVQGRDLNALLQAGELEPGMALRLCMDVCSALTAAHDAGLCHGDLKASNILVTADGRVRLCDFCLPPCSENMDAGGSAYSLSPEQLRGGEPDYRSDLFALGCLLYRLLYGDYPFPVGGSDWRERRLTPAPTPDQSRTAGHPAELLSLVRDLLDTDPGLRPASAHVVRQQLLTLSRAFPAGEASLLSGHLDQSVAAEPKAVYGTTEEPHRGLLRRYQMPALVLVALALLGTALYPKQSAAPAQAVRVEGIYVTGSPALGRARLEALLGEVIANENGVMPSESVDAAVIALHVECASEVCSSQLVWRRDSIELADTRALLVSASAQVWERRLRQGLRELTYP